MPKQRLTDRQLISGVTLTDLLHFVVTGDTSQNPAGSSYKGNVEQLFDAFSAYTCTNPLVLDTVNSCTTGITINGNVVINGSATTINTEVIQSKDNNIVLNYSGTHLTAIGGGITLEDGVSDGVDSKIFTNSDGVWLFDPGLSASTGTIDDFTANTISVTTIGNSGDCVNDLYVSNIHSCSPLNINPLDEGNIYFGSTSGVTVDLTNVRLGIGTTSPNYQFVTTGSTGYFYYDGSEVRNAYRQSELAIFGPPSGITNVSVKQFTPPGKSVELGMFVVGEDTPNTALWRGIGKSGDTTLYSSSGTQDLNIINGTGSGTTDNINFFAGFLGNITNQTPDLHIHGSGSTKGYIGINNNNPQYTLDVTGEARISGSGQNILTIIGSGDTNPLFTIQGSSGELFSVTDSLVGSLFSVNDISGLPILEVFDDDTVHMGSYQAPSLNTTVRLTPSTGLSTVYSIPMSAYTGAWFEYTVSNTGGARAGQIMSIFSGNTVNFTETTTTDIGSTSDITFSMSADSTNTLLQVSATTTGWEVKTIVRSI